DRHPHNAPTGNTVHIEPRAPVQLANHLAGLIFEERDEVTRSLWELTRQCYERRAEIDALTELLARVDFSLARAKVAREYGMRAPAFGAGGPLVLLEARHPLLLRLQEEGP